MALGVILRGAGVDDEDVLAAADLAQEVLGGDDVFILGEGGEVFHGLSCHILGVGGGGGLVASLLPAVVHAAGQVVGVIAQQAQDAHHLGSGLAAVAVNIDRLVIGDAVQLLSHGSAVGDVDSALDVAFGVVLGLAQVDDKTGGAVLDFG